MIEGEYESQICYSIPGFRDSFCLPVYIHSLWWISSKSLEKNKGVLLASQDTQPLTTGRLILYLQTSRSWHGL